MTHIVGYFSFDKELYSILTNGRAGQQNFTRPS